MIRLVFRSVSILVFAAGLFGAAPEVHSQAAQKKSPEPIKKIIARAYDSGFKEAHDTYNGISAASDGKIYYVLSSQGIDIGGKMFVFDPRLDRIEYLGDLTEACGEKGRKAVPQGKSHVRFYEAEGKLYFATHCGFYIIRDGMEILPDPPPAGYKPYPGGHFLSFDIGSRKFACLATAPGGEGILSMTMDVRRKRLYGLTWPSGYFIRYDMLRNELKNLGTVFEKGEAVKGALYRTVCRSLAIDPDEGSVYFTSSTGTIYRYRPDLDAVSAVEWENLRKDYFGRYDPTSPGHMGYNWRQTVWNPSDHALYGVHGNSGYLFRFDPRGFALDVLDRITSDPSKRSGMYDQFSYGYLGFTLGPDGRTLYYLTGGPVYVKGKRVTGKSSTAKGEAKGVENLHLVTYDIPTASCRDHGPIFFPNGERPSYVNSIAVASDSRVFTIARIPDHGRERIDLISIPAPRLVK